MKPTGTTLRPSFVSAHPLPSMLAAVVIIAALGLAGLSLRRASAPRLAAETGVRPAPVYDATGAMLAAIGSGSSVSPAATRLVPVYDATGAMLTAVVPQAAAYLPVPVYDAGSVRMTVIAPWAPPYRPAPVYDATGAMWLAVPSIKP